MAQSIQFSSAAQLLWDWKAPIAATSVTLGTLVPLALSAPFFHHMVSTSIKYHWIGADRSEEPAPGIFDSPKRLDLMKPTLEDKRTFFQILFHRYVAFFRDVCSQARVKCYAVLDWMGYPQEQYVVPADKREWSQNSTGLYVFVHGIHGHPASWHAYKQVIEKRHASADVCLIKMHQAGDCKLSEATDPIFEMIADYCIKNPNKRVALVGTSRGGQVVTDLEHRLRSHENNPRVYMVTIVGAHHGSLMMNLLQKLRLSWLWFSQDATQELSFNSRVSTSLLEQNKSLSVTERIFRSYCTTEDFQVLPCTSALLTMGEQHYVHGWGHISVVDHVRKHVLEEMIPWMQAD